MLPFLYTVNLAPRPLTVVSVPLTFVYIAADSQYSISVVFCAAASVCAVELCGGAVNSTFGSIK